MNNLTWDTFDFDFDGFRESVNQTRGDIDRVVNRKFAAIAHDIVRHHATSGVDIGHHLELNKVSNFQPTFMDTGENLDHVLCDFIPQSVKTTLFTNEESGLSDHKLMLVEMVLE